jgi:hypothetical protein
VLGSDIIVQPTFDSIELPHQEIGEEHELSRFRGVIPPHHRVSEGIPDSAEGAREQLHDSLPLTWLGFGISQRPAARFEGGLHQRNTDEALTLDASGLAGECSDPALDRSESSKGCLLEGSDRHEIAQFSFKDRMQVDAETSSGTHDVTGVASPPQIHSEPCPAAHLASSAVLVPRVGGRPRHEQTVMNQPIERGRQRHGGVRMLLERIHAVDARTLRSRGHLADEPSDFVVTTERRS